MKKSILLTTTLLVLALHCLAGPVDSVKALRIAERLLLKPMMAPMPISKFFASDAKEQVLVQLPNNIFLVTATDEKSFAIIASDGETQRVIGYSKTNAPKKGEPIPEALAQILSSTWGQGMPYNYYTPAGNPVGCVATAMAQIMYYWKWPKQGKGRSSYRLNGEVLSVNFANSHYDWDNMHDTNDENSSSESQQAVSKLCYDCGVAIQMQYSAEGSGTYTQYVLRALHTFFGYRASTLQELRREFFPSKEAWNAVITDELVAGRPVIYAATAPKGGHAFVLDGYDKDGLFHVNWGWDGNYNGYYDVLICNVNGYTFDANHRIITGIEPDYEGTDTKPQQLRLVLDKGPTIVSSEAITTGTPFTVNPGYIYSLNYLNAVWKTAIALYDIKGHFIDIICSKPFSDGLPYGYGFDERTMEVTIPENTPNGYYTLRTVIRQDGYDTWVRPSVKNGEEIDIMFIQVENGNVTAPVSPPTAINEITTNTSSHVVYNLKGQQQRNLQRGINVVNGKMILVK